MNENASQSTQSQCLLLASLWKRGIGPRKSKKERKKEKRKREKMREEGGREEGGDRNWKGIKERENSLNDWNTLSSSLLTLCDHAPYQVLLKHKDNREKWDARVELSLLWVSVRLDSNGCSIRYLLPFSECVAGL